MIRRLRSAPRIADSVIAAAVFVTAALWGTGYWKASFRAGRQPAFYQPYFEPAVMMACGHGFHLAAPSVPAITAFVQLRRDTLSCSEIPADTATTDRGLYQKAWMYLMVTVAFAWRVLGVSWSGLGPLFGILFGATIAAAYGIFRLGMGRTISVIVAGALSISAVHLQNLPHLRDYAKAPFTLALFALLALLVARPATLKRLLAVAVLYGATLGIGYGFRTDFLVEIPLFPIVVLAFLPGRWLDHLAARLAAVAVCAVTFVAVAWPILTTVQQRGGCQWHAVLLGLTDGPTDALMVSRTPYTFGEDFSDDAVYAAATAYALRSDPGTGHIEYCSHEYDSVTERYVLSLARTFPADFLTRGLASVAQVVQLPFRWFDQPLPGWWSALYAARRVMLKTLRGGGVVAMAITLLGLLAWRARVGLFAVFFLLYVGGYPALQFDIRHYFHLEFITWWAIGFLLHQAVIHWRAADGRARSMLLEIRTRYDWIGGARIAGAIVGGVVIALWVCRGYQQVSASRLFQSYVDAPKQLVADVSADSRLQRMRLSHARESDPGAGFLEIDLDVPHCGAEPSILFAYDRPSSFSPVRKLEQRSAGDEPTRVFHPVYAGFTGVKFTDITPACLKTVAWVSVPNRVPLLLAATLPPSWRRTPLFETLTPLRWRW
jgi:hypothetical protein